MKDEGKSQNRVDLVKCYSGRGSFLPSYHSRLLNWMPLTKIVVSMDDTMKGENKTEPSFVHLGMPMDKGI